MIEINSLTKKYGKITAVDNLSLEIKTGECFGFLGPNGAGKTTTIKIMTGLLKPTQGTIYIGGNGSSKSGYDINKDPQKAKSIMGYIPDAPFLYEKLTGQEFLNFILGIFQIDPKKAVEKINYYLNLFELDDHRHDLIESYSHGMRQKIVMTSALIHDPKILIVDEPMVGLDPKSSRTVKDIFRKQRDEGKTIFLSTHTLSVAEELCDRIGIINHGKIVALGTMEELRSISQRDKNGIGADLESIFLTLTKEEHDNR